MNALKHMELIFGVVLLAAVAIAAMPQRPVAPAQPAARTTPPQPVQVVVVKGKRMTDVEKRAALSAEPRPETNGS
jgi:hypothetical protein